MREDILVVRLSSLGDVVLSSSFLRACRDLFPAACITYAVRADLAPLAAALPGVERLVAIDRRAGLAVLLALAAQLRQRRFAHVFDLHHSLRSRLLCAGLRHRRPGFGKQALPRWLLVHAHRDVYARHGGGRPLRDRMLEPLRRMGLEPRLHDTALVLPAAARERARAALAGFATQGPLVALAPGAHWPAKCWPVERFAVLAARLAEDGARLVLLGSDAERTTAGVVSLGTPRAACLDLCGRLDLLETAAVLERCTALVGNDSGLVHVAEAVGRPVVALFGPTAPQFGYAPYRAGSRLLREPPPCSPCSKNGSRPCSQRTHLCMENLAVETVHAALRPLLAVPVATP